MKKSHIVSGLFFVLVAVFSGWILFRHNFRTESTDADDTDSTESVAFEEYVEESKYRNVGIKKEISHDDTYDTHISFPVFSNDEINNQIYKYIEKQRSDFLTLHDEIKAEPEDDMELNISFEIFQINDTTYSIAMSSSTYGRIANPIHNDKYFIVDTSNHHFLDKNNLFDIEQQELFKKKVKENLMSQPNLDIFEDYLDEELNSNNIFEHLYFTKGKAVVQFSQYDIAPGSSGKPKAEFTYNELSNILKNEWVNDLKIASKKSHSTPDTDEEFRESKESIPDKSPKEIAEQGVKQVAFTFDDGPHPTYTQEILEILDEYDAKATFFVLGNNVDFYPHIVKETYNKGHEIGNHSWNHPNLVNLGEDQITTEISDTDKAVKKATGTITKLYRPPYGSHNEAVDSIVKKPAVSWDVDTLDWQNRDPQAILTNVREQTEDGSIILMHDIHKETVEGFRLSIDYLDSLGYEFVTVSEMHE